MKRLGLCVVALAIGALVTPAALGQRGGRGGGGGFGTVALLGQKSVQKELNLTDDQMKTVTELQAKAREARQGLRNLSREERRAKMQELAKADEKAVADLLKPEQVKRLKQISLQLRGASAFANEEVAKALTLTDEQKEKLKAIQDETGKAIRELFQGGGDRTEMRKKITELRKGANEKAMALLTDDQKTKWKEMTGTPFKGEITFGGRGRRGGGGGGRPDRS
jgi:Spy/CpxP family protein refolding chaperone